MKPTNDARRVLRKMARKGFRGYPTATIAFYGPDDTIASKAAVGIFLQENAESSDMHRWLSNTGDIRQDEKIASEILEFIRKQGAKSVAMPYAIIGCPHEEVIDYPEGEKCPHCPFWADRDRWAKVIPTDKPR